MISLGRSFHNGMALDNATFAEIEQNSPSAAMFFTKFSPDSSFDGMPAHSPIREARMMYAFVVRLPLSPSSTGLLITARI